MHKPIIQTAAICLALSLPVHAQVKPQALMDKVYEGYLRGPQCWLSTDQESQQRYCMKIDRVDRISVNGTSRLYVMATGEAISDQNEPNGSHATSGMVGAFVVEERGSQPVVLAGHAQLPVGVSGAAPTGWKWVKLGPADYWGWQNTFNDCHQGYCGTAYLVLAPYGKGIKEIASFASAFDSSGACTDKRCEARSSALEARISIDNTQIQAKVFPLVAQVRGKLDGKTVPAKTWPFGFDEKKWMYVPPKDWPLANADF